MVRTTRRHIVLLAHCKGASAVHATARLQRAHCNGACDEGDAKVKCIEFAANKVMVKKSLLVLKHAVKCLCCGQFEGMLYYVCTEQVRVTKSM